MYTPVSYGQQGQNDNSTASPIKHVIIIVGENRSFDHLYATYVPQNQGEGVNNLLSEGIINVSGPIPVRILRAAQFHEFVETLMNWGTKGDASYVPKMRTQLVAARTVAEALADLATDPRPITASSNAPIPEIAGPIEENLADAARRLVARRGDSLRIEAVSNPDDPAAALYESGALLPSPHAKLAGPTFDEWLEVTIPASAAARPFRAA